MKKLIVLIAGLIFIVGCTSGSSSKTIDPPTAEQLLPDLYPVVKDETYNGVRWIAYDTKTEHPDKGHYDLWVIGEGKQPKFIDTYPYSLDFASSVDWEFRGDNYVNFDYYTGGLEGGTNTRILYSKSGSEHSRISYHVPLPQKLTYGNARKTEITYITDGQCDDHPIPPPSETNVIGIQTVSGLSTETTRKYKFAEPVTMGCAEFYTTVVPPVMKLKDLATDRIEIELPDGSVATLYHSHHQEPQLKGKQFLRYAGEDIEAEVSVVDLEVN